MRKWRKQTANDDGSQPNHGSGDAMQVHWQVHWQTRRCMQSHSPFTMILSPIPRAKHWPSSPPSKRSNQHPRSAKCLEPHHVPRPPKKEGRWFRPPGGPVSGPMTNYHSLHGQDVSYRLGRLFESGQLAGEPYEDEGAIRSSSCKPPSGWHSST